MHRLKFILLCLFSLLFIYACNSGSDNSSNSGSGDTAGSVSYTISFNENGGTGLMDTLTVSAGDTVRLPDNTFVCAGFTFTGWALSKNGEVVYTNGDTITVNSNTTLYAVWSPNDSPLVYTVVFNANGGSGSMDNQLFNAGEKKTLSANSFYYSGHIFSGWSISPNGSPVYSDMESIVCSSDLLLYAVWIKEDTGGEAVPSNVYTIYFNSNNGDGYMIPITCEAGKSIQLSENIYSRAGFVFKGWSKEQNGVVEYYDKQTISLIEDITLYAVWEPVKTYTITYHSNTSFADEIKKSVKQPPLVGSSIMLDLNEFTNGDLKFVGWSLNKNDNKVVYQDAGPLYELTADIDLYAVWDSNPVVISFSANGGLGEMPDLYARPGDIIKLPNAVFTREGYKLKGAYAPSIVTGTWLYSFGMDYEVTNENITFSALWVELPKPPVSVFGGNSKIYRNQDVWVKGVTVNKEDWIQSLSPDLYYAVRKSNSGWYDADQSWYNLCWAASASNLLHWWHDMNKENVKKYFDYYASNDAVKPNTLYEGWGISNIFKYFRDMWPNSGYFTDRGLIWYLIGKEDTRAGGAFYKEVFGETFNLVEYYNGLTQYMFNTAMDKAFQNGMAVSSSEVNLSGSHAITIWGAHFNEIGLIDKIYVSDSATAAGSNAPKGYETGISSIDIVYDDVYGKVYMKTYLGGQIPLTSLTLLSDGAKEWEDYFNTHKPLR